jgi:CheY-like chemotaxis protein
MTMPGLTGDKLATGILKIKPDIPIILCTVFSETMSQTKAVELGIKKYVQKPIENITLTGLVREILDE